MADREMNDRRVNRVGSALVLVVAAGLAGRPAGAQDAAPASPPWQLSLTPYLWATALKGDVGVGRRIDAEVDASFKDIWDNLNGALMLEGELRKGRFGLISDTIYADLEDDAATAEDRLKVDAKSKMFIQSLAGTYRVGTWRLADTGAGPLAVTVDPYAGLRYTYLDAELRGRLDLPDLGVAARRTAEQDEHWVDPIVGVRTAWTLGERWSLVLAGDVGGVSASDQYSAEAFGLVGYRFGLFGEGNANLLAGYRVLKQKYEDGDGRNAFDWDVTIHGPIAGLKITF
jgi:hypothetical protein